MTARLIFAAALAAIPCLVSAQTIEDVLRADGWAGAREMSSDSIAFFGGLLGRADWNNPAPECARVEDYTTRMFDEVYWYVGNHPGHWGEYYPEVPLNNGDTIQLVAFDSDLWPLPSLALEMLLHEGAHHAGYEDNGSFDAYDAENCAVLKPLEDDDDPATGGGGGGEESCTPTQEWVPPVTIPVFVRPESTQGEGGTPVDTDHEAIPIEGIEVRVEGGYWTEVELVEGYWKTIPCEN